MRLARRLPRRPAGAPYAVNAVTGQATGAPDSAITPITILGGALIAWWTADRADLITLAGAAVTSWKDVIAGYDAVQAVSDARPAYSTTSFNGTPAVSSDGVDDELTCTDAALLAALPDGAEGCEIWDIVQQDSLAADATSRRITAYGGSGGTTVRRSGRQVATGVNRGAVGVGTGAGTGAKVDAVVDFSSRHVMRCVITPTGMNIALDGNSLVTETASVPATTVLRLRHFANASTTAGEFALVRKRDTLITAPLTDAQVTALWAWSLPRRNL